MDTEADTHGDLDGTPAPNAEQLARARRNLENAKRIRLQRATARQPVVREDFGGAGKKAGGFFATLHTETSRPLPKVAESEPTLLLPLEQNERCSQCPSIELDFAIKAGFGVNVCDSCRTKHSEDFAMITKSTAKEMYLLTDEELRDAAVLPSITKPNPHKSSWSDMHLYLQCQVRQFAVTKWGSLAALGEEVASRDAAKQSKRDKKFQGKLAELRRKTRSSAIKQSLSQAVPRHEHVFSEDATQGGSTVRRCTVCGIPVESEEF